MSPIIGSGDTPYEQATGAVIETIMDVNMTQTSAFANLPTGWTTPSGGGLHLTTTCEVDDLGRVIMETDASGNVTYTRYNDAPHETWVYPCWDSTDRPTRRPG